MKYIGVLAGLVLLLSSSLCLGADIRNANWGMPVDQVKIVETAGELTREGELYISYSATLAGKPCGIDYIFGDKGLYCLKYVVSGIKKDEVNEYITVVYSVLTKKYGEPSETPTKTYAIWMVDGLRIDLTVADDMLWLDYIYSAFDPREEDETKAQKKLEEAVKEHMDEF